MYNNMMNIAIVGYGHISRSHINAIQSISNARVFALYNADRDRSVWVAKEYGIPHIYTKYRQLVANKDINVVDIITPAGMHDDMAEEAAHYGNHVIVEKPMETTLKRADSMIDACREAEVKLSVIMQHRFDPAVGIIKKAIEDQKLGKLLLADVHIKYRRTQDYYDYGNGRGTWDMDGGGILMNQGINMLDLLLYLLGDVESVCGFYDTAAHKGIEVEDVASASVRFKSGVLASISATTGAYPWLPASLEINGTEGTVKVEQEKITHFEIEDKEYQQMVYEMLNSESANTSKKVYKHMSHKKQLEDIIRSIQEDGEPSVNGEEGRKSLELVLAIYESVRAGQPVILS